MVMAVLDKSVEKRSEEMRCTRCTLMVNTESARPTAKKQGFEAGLQ